MFFLLMQVRARHMTFQLGDYNVHSDDNFNGDESICVQVGETLSVTVN